MKLVPPEPLFFEAPSRLAEEDLYALRAKAGELEELLAQLRARYAEAKDDDGYRLDDDLDDYVRQICRQLLRAVDANGLGGCRLCRS